MSRETGIKNKYWAPFVSNLNYIENLIKPGAKVLEIGPGGRPFTKATHFCGWTQEEHNLLPNYKIVNIATDIFPYKDKEFDFVYCRHVIEDIWNPVNALKEISRIAKEGYIETPSPLCEMTKGVDHGDPSYRGYAHHRYIIWSDQEKINILPKFPIIEHALFEEEKLQKALEEPFQWCTFFHFKDKIKYKLYEMGREQDFVFYNNSYFQIISQAIYTQSERSKIWKKKQTP